MWCAAQWLTAVHIFYELSIKTHLNSKCFSTPVEKTLRTNIVNINDMWLNKNVYEIIIIP
jgi:hypothetical protein